MPLRRAPPSAKRRRGDQRRVRGLPMNRACRRPRPSLGASSVAGPAHLAVRLLHPVPTPAFPIPTSPFLPRAAPLRAPRTWQSDLVQLLACSVSRHQIFLHCTQLPCILTSQRMAWWKSACTLRHELLAHAGLVQLHACTSSSMVRCRLSCRSRRSASVMRMRVSSYCRAGCGRHAAQHTKRVSGWSQGGGWRCARWGGRRANSGRTASDASTRAGRGEAAE